MTEAFISYSRKDKDFVKALDTAFKKCDRDIWVDWDSIALTEDFLQAIYKGIEAANNFVFIISPDSVASEYCGKEILHAIAQNKRLIPILRREVDPKTVHPDMAALNWIFFRENDDFDQAFQSLLQSIDTDLDYIKAHTRLQIRALEWDSKKRNPSFLVRGDDLKDARQWLSVGYSKQPIPTPLQTQYITDSSLAEAKSQRKTIAGIGFGFIVSSLLALVALYQYREAVKNQQEAQKNEVRSLASGAVSQFLNQDQLGALINSIKSNQKIKQYYWSSPEISSISLTVLREIIYEIQERNRLQKHTDKVWSVSFSSDGQTIASGSDDGDVILWDKDGKHLTTLKSKGGRISSVSFSPDGLIAAGSSDRKIKLWNKDHVPIKSIIGHKDKVWDVKFSPDGQIIASASKDKTVKLWSQDGRLLKTIPHDDEVYSVSFSLNGQTIVSGGKDKKVRLWNKNGGLLNTFTGHTEQIMKVIFSPDGKTIASASTDDTVRLWQLDGTPAIKLIKTNNNVYSISFSRDGQTLVSANGDNSVQLWDLKGNLLNTLQKHDDSVLDVKFSPDGKTIASAGADNQVKLWSNEQNQVKTLYSHPGSVNTVSFSPDNTRLVSGGEDSEVILWKYDGTLIQRRKDHHARVNSVRFSPNSQIFASASDDQTIIFWSKDGVLQKTLKGHSDAVRALAWSPDGQLLASGSADKTIVLWKSNGTKIKTFTGHTGEIRDVSFRPDGKMIASASDDGTVKLWTIEGKLLQTLTGHQGKVRTVRFSPDGKLIASGGQDKIIHWWHLDGTIVNNFQDKFKGEVREIDWSSDSSLLASTNEKYGIFILNQKGKLLKIFSGHKGAVLGVSFSSDKQRFASAGADNTVKIWQLDGSNQEVSDLDELLKQGCDWVRNYLENNPNIKESDRHLCDSQK